MGLKLDDFITRTGTQRLMTLNDWVEVAKGLGGQVVGERTIDHRDDYGGYSWDVLDYEPNKKLLRKYLVLELPPEGEWNPYPEEIGENG